jgi:hypothetical protein
MDYDYSNVSEYEKSFLPDGFQGNVYNISYKWLQFIPESSEPLMIMEIGAYHGANVCSYMKTYAKHPKTEVHVVDPWFDYNGYNEYQTKQSTNYSTFMNNISKLDPKDLDKIYLHRGLSENIVPIFKNESYDIIYIDGNHEIRYVIEDCVLCFKKIKKGGWIIIDDMHDNDVNKGVRIFLEGYLSYFELVAIHNGQLFMRRV